MSLNEILGSAMSGLAASQAGMRTVSNNIANVGTAGYARERATQSTGVTGGRVSGVVIGEPERIADKFLENAVYRRGGDMGRSSAASSYLDRIQSLLGAPGSEAGLPARIDAIATSAARMTGLQGSAQTVAAFTGNVQDTIISLNQLDRDIDNLRADAETELGHSVEKINQLLTRIHDLNDSVAQLTGLGRSSAGASDQRMSALQELSGLAKISVREQPDGRVSIDTASGQVLLDKRLRLLSYPGGSGASQPTYPPIDIRFATADGLAGASTGEKIDSAAIGGKLGGLIDLRDRALPDYSEKLGVLFSGLSEALNAASNNGTVLPPPQSLIGRPTGLVGADRLGFTGSAVFAVTKSNGELVAKTSIDFSALPATATINDALAAINTGLAGAGIATLVDGRLTISANAPGNGVAMAQNPANPSQRAGVGFSQFFGLNDLVRSGTSALTPTGFSTSDPHGFAPGQTAELVLRDATGRVLGSHTFTGTGGPNFGDVLTELNSGSLGSFGSFAMDDRGRIQFKPIVAATGATLTIPSDSTNRLGTGRSFSALSGLNGQSSGLSTAEVRPDLLASATRMPLALLQTGVAIGQKAIGPGDIRGATAFVDQLAKSIDLGKDGKATVQHFSNQLLGRIGAQAAQAENAMEDATARHDAAVGRRDNYSGVNVDEELAQMVVLQNSYSAAARVMTTASQMYDTLIEMLR